MVRLSRFKRTLMILVPLSASILSELFSETFRMTTGRISLTKDQNQNFGLEFEIFEIDETEIVH